MRTNRKSGENASVLIQFHLICQMLTKFCGVDSERTVSKFRIRKRKLLCCVHLFHKAGARNQEVSCRSRSTTSKKCTKKRDGRAKLLFCYLNLLLFCRSLCHRPRCCSRWLDPVFLQLHPPSLNLLYFNKLIFIVKTL